MSEQKSLLVLGDPVYVHSLMTREEYNQSKRELKGKTHTSYDARLETKKCNGKLDKWRDCNISEEEMRVYNAGIDKLLAKTK